MITYNIKQRKSPKDGTKKWYAAAQTTSYMNLEQVAANISRECTVTIHDVKAVLSALQEQIILALQAGKSVRFGDLGSFHVTLKSKGADTEKDFSKKYIRRVMVRFTKSGKMRSAFRLTNDEIKLVTKAEEEASDKGSQTTGGSGSSTSGDQGGSGAVDPNA